MTMSVSLGCCYADGVVEVDCLVQGGSGIVGMAGIVDLTTFDHEEEALLVALVVEVVDGCGGHLCQGEVAVAGIDGIGERVLYCIALLDEQYLVARVAEGGIFVIAADDGVACLSGKVVELWGGMVVRVGILGKVASTKELEA